MWNKTYIATTCIIFIKIGENVLKKWTYDFVNKINAYSAIAIVPNTIKTEPNLWLLDNIRDFTTA